MLKLMSASSLYSPSVSFFLILFSTPIIHVQVLQCIKKKATENTEKIKTKKLNIENIKPNKKTNKQKQTK